jgi:hypothetical protein
MSAYSEDYRELVEDARDAVYKLLRESTPDSLISLRFQYKELRRILESDDRERQKEQGRQATDEQDESTFARLRREREEAAERRDVWKRMPREQRESALFQVLGDERLTIRELASRLGTEVDEYIYEGNLRPLVMAMFHGGQLERVEETFRNKPRHRYFRKRGLDGPIVDLDRAYHDEEEDR